MPKYRFWPINATAPQCYANSLSDMRATIRGWWPRSVKLSQVTNEYGEVSVYMNDTLYGHIEIIAAIEVGN